MQRAWKGRSRTIGESGEDVGGISKWMTRKELIAAIGRDLTDVRHAVRLVEIEERGAHGDLMGEIVKRHRQAKKNASPMVWHDAAGGRSR